MRYTKVSLVNDLPVSTNNPPHATDGTSTSDIPEDASKIKYMYYPRIKCKDCPGKLYTPGPETGVNNFEVHLKNRLHREKVDRRIATRGGNSGIQAQLGRATG